MLILRFLAGWTTAEVAAAFLVDTTAMQQRIVRAKKRITATGIPFGRPGPTELEERLPGVLRAVCRRGRPPPPRRWSSRRGSEGMSTILSPSRRVDGRT
ncbi:Uncharacterised protein [Brevibacterium casei]|uniref:RNA polymerase sigma factor 70 region 4 type 2 domain-containing protein n=1 Tax=Brevibacterium casei TaxID=33889 RepID=A0A449CZ22_9MICO|nr:sigma factor-like helix-turn-helix DNA-binding protein [Brevibacterium casei]VEW10577.1 Uncharacterised protein [Brevibacterium casei]